MNIEPFDQNNIDAVEKMVTAVWGHPDKRPEYDHAFCGHLTRYSYYDPELSFQIADKDGIQGVCWAYVPGESNDADAWLEKVATILTDDERNGAYANVEYLKSTDALIGKLEERGREKCVVYEGPISSRSRHQCNRQGSRQVRGSSNPAHIQENIESFTFTLSDDEMKQIAALNKEKRYFNMSYEQIKAWMGDYELWD